MEIRQPQEGELAQLAELPDGSLPPEWLAWADEPHRVVVAVDGTRVVGAAHLAVVGPGEGWVEGVRARPEADRVQDRLVEAALEVLHGYGVCVWCAPLGPRTALRGGWSGPALRPGRGSRCGSQAGSPGGPGLPGRWTVASCGTL